MRAPDWLAALDERNPAPGSELAIADLSAGDRLQIATANSVYDFRMLGGRDAEARCSRPDRPQGRVRLMGCTFGMSSAIKPGHIFCGGSLEFTFDGGRQVHNTTAITAIRHWRCGAEAEDLGE